MLHLHMHHRLNTIILPSASQETNEVPSDLYCWHEVAADFVRPVDEGNLHNLVTCPSPLTFHLGNIENISMLSKISAIVHISSLYTVNKIILLYSIIWIIDYICEIHYIFQIFTLTPLTMLCLNKHKLLIFHCCDSLVTYMCILHELLLPIALSISTDEMAAANRQQSNARTMDKSC